MIKALRENQFIRQVTLLAGGTAMAQLINLLSLPVITRLYSPEDFGVLAVMTAVAAMGGVIISLRYENAIIAVHSIDDAKKGVYSIFWISLLLCLVGFVTFTVIAYLVDLSRKYYSVGVLSTLLMLTSAWVQALYFYNNKISNYKHMTKGRVYAALVLAFTSIGWGITQGGYLGLLLGAFLGMLSNFIYLFGITKGVSLLEFYQQRSNVVNFAVVNNRFPKFLVVSSLIDRAGSQGYLLVFTKFFGESVAGSLSLYNKIAGLPSVLVGNAVGDVFKRNASERLRETEECKRLFIKTAKSLILLAVTPFLLLAFLAPFAFSFVFGGEWGIAGEYAQILSPVFFMGFVVSPLSSLIYLEDNQRYDLMLQVILFSLLVMSLTLAIIFGDAYWAVIAYATSYFVKYIIEALICWNIAKGPNRLDL